MWYRPRRCASWFILLLLAAGCQPAGQYPVAPQGQSGAAEATTTPAVPPGYSWRDPHPPLAIPIRFVDAASSPQEWQKLPTFWNHEWGGIGGQRTVHLGLWPLGALAALRLSAAHEVIKIKVPLGLPDPNPNVPAVNPPTYEKWLLGKKLFFDRQLLPGPELKRTYACADCHKPDTGYTLQRATAPYGVMNIPSLINCVYNRHQFWDGRADYLEEVIQRNLADEAQPTNQREDAAPEVRHRWGGVVAGLRGRPEYVRAFQRVFGTNATQDNIAKAIATYLRTILSGNSVYDRAEAQRARRKGDALQRSDFWAVLDDRTLAAIAGEQMTRQGAAAELLRGHALFHGKARCAVCHPGPLFTDRDFHNVGVGESESFDNSIGGKEKGRFVYLPPGLKARRYIGAFKTPTLRNLPRTAPYLHDGSRKTLASVLHYFNGGLRADLNPFLDPELRDGRSAWHPELSGEETQALEMFLKALEGERIPPKISEP